jgi:hypothetical protein
MTSWRRRYGAATTEVVISPESWRGAVAAARSAAWPRRARCLRLQMSQPVNLTCWHQTAWVSAGRAPHRTPHRAPQRRAQDRSQGFQSSMSAAWPGLSAGSRWLMSKVMPSPRAPRPPTRQPWQPDSGSGRPRPAHRRTALSPSAACRGQDGTTLAAQPTRRSASIQRRKPVSFSGDLPSCQLRPPVLPPQRQTPRPRESPAST